MPVICFLGSGDPDPKKRRTGGTGSGSRQGADPPKEETEAEKARCFFLKGGEG